MSRRHEALIPLSHDHRDALALAFRLHHPAPPGPVTPTTPASTPASRRAETLAFFQSKLEPHFAIEEEVLFPALLRGTGVGAGRWHETVERLLDEHGRMRELYRAIEAAEKGPVLDRALTDFADLLESHVRTEERSLFATFPGDLPAAEVAALRSEIHHRRPPDGTR
jgi:hypothetical protein